MQHKTQTTLGLLREGDRFYFPKDINEVWQVTSKTPRAVALNQFINDQKIYKYDELKKASTPVVFLRHTIPAQGEQWSIEQLRRGDVFHLEGDILTEYIVTYNHYPRKLFIDCVFWVGDNNDHSVKIDCGTRVTYCYNANDRNKTNEKQIPF